MPKKTKFKDEELQQIHGGRGFKKGVKAEAGRRLKEHQRGLFALVIVFILGAIFGVLITRDRD